jgi:hypothetical protein
MVAVATMLSPTVLVGFIITPPAMAGVAVFRAPTVATTAAVTVPPMQATAVLLAPFLGTVVPVAAPTMPATAQFRIPTVAAGATVTSPLMQAIAALLAPAVSTAYAELPPTMGAVALMPAPAVTSGVGVSPPLILAAAAMLAPIVALGGPILPPPMPAVAAMGAPTTSSGVGIGGGATYTDDFNRPDNTTAGPNWTLQTSSTVGIQSGHLYPIATTKSGFQPITWATPMPQDDIAVSLTLGPMVGSGAEDTYLILGANTAGQFVFCQVDGTRIRLLYTSDWALSTSVVAADMAAYIPATGDTITLTRFGNVYTVQINGTSQGSWTDTTSVQPIDSSHRLVGVSVFQATGSGVYRTVDSWSATTPGTILPVMAGAAVMPAPTVAATASVTLTAPLLAAVAAMPTPTIGTVPPITVTAPLLHATAAIPTPTVTAGTSITITAPLLHAAAAMPAPTVSVQAPLSYDSLGGAFNQPVVSTGSWTQTCTAGDYVLVFLVTGFQHPGVAPSSVTYAGSAMTQKGVKLASSTNNIGSGDLYVYGIAGVPAGSQTAQVNMSASDHIFANSVSFKNVGSVSAAQTVGSSSSGTNASQPVSCAAGQMIAQSFMVISGNAPTFSGGTNVYNDAAMYSYVSQALSISYANSTTTFGESGGTTSQWQGIALVLS